MYYEILLFGELVWNLPLLTCLLGILFLYVFLLKRSTTLNLYNKQPLRFFLSICLLYLIIGSPLSAFSHLSFSLHMIQMSILYFIVPPLILAGIPTQLYEYVTNTQKIKWPGNLALPSNLSLFIFSLLLLIYHLPFSVNIFSQYPFIQNGLLFFLFFLSFNLWWPIVSPDPKQRLSKERRKRFLFLSGALLMPACTIFIFNALMGGVDHPILNQISAQLCLPPEAISLNLSPSASNIKSDQVMAGLLMLGIHKGGMILSSHLVNDRNSDVKGERKD